MPSAVITRDADGVAVTLGAPAGCTRGWGLHARRSGGQRRGRHGRGRGQGFFDEAAHGVRVDLDRDPVGRGLGDPAGPLGIVRKTRSSPVKPAQLAERLVEVPAPVEDHVPT